MNHIPYDIQKTIVDAIGDGLMSTLTAIRTLYVDKQLKFSGTGLLLSYGTDEVYCLTANHVVSPETRSPIPELTPVNCHYYAHYLRRDIDTKSLMLRRRVFKSKLLDLALLESCISGNPTAKNIRPLYFDYEYVKASGNHDIFIDDILIIAGLPNQFLFEITGIAHSSHRALFHLFTGAQGSEDEVTSHLYEVPYTSDISPHSMSGSPVWLIRATEHEGKPLDPEYLRTTNSNELKLTASFAGMVVVYKKESKKLGIVKAGACAEFAKSAEPRMKDLRNPVEDDLIEIELNNLVGRL